jgi:hypothetical protein
MAIKHIIVLFVETPRKFITAKVVHVTHFERFVPVQVEPILTRFRWPTMDLIETSNGPFALQTKF